MSGAGATAGLAAALGALLLSGGCASMGFKYDEGELRKQVAFESHCPAERIKVVRAMEAGVGHSKFELDVCGAQQRWDRYGTSYFPEGKGPVANR